VLVFSQFKPKLGTIEMILSGLLIVSLAVNAKFVYEKSSPNSRPVALAKGQLFPALKLKSTQNDRSIDSNKFRLVYWFSPTCKFCLANREKVGRLAKVLREHQIQMIMLSNPEPTSKQYCDSNNFGFGCWEVVRAEFPLRKLGGTPTLFLIGMDGVIKDRWSGILSSQTVTSIGSYLQPNMEI